MQVGASLILQLGFGERIVGKASEAHLCCSCWHHLPVPPPPALLLRTGTAATSSGKSVFASLPMGIGLCYAWTAGAGVWQPLSAGTMELGKLRALVGRRLRDVAVFLTLSFWIAGFIIGAHPSSCMLSLDEVPAAAAFRTSSRSGWPAWLRAARCPARELPATASLIPDRCSEPVVDCRSLSGVQMAQGRHSRFPLQGKPGPVCCMYASRPRGSSSLAGNLPGVRSSHIASTLPAAHEPTGTVIIRKLPRLLPQLALLAVPLRIKPPGFVQRFLRFSLVASHEYFPVK